MIPFRWVLYYDIGYLVLCKKKDQVAGKFPIVIFIVSINLGRVFSVISSLVIQQWLRWWLMNFVDVYGLSVGLFSVILLFRDELFNISHRVNRIAVCTLKNLIEGHWSFQTYVIYGFTILQTILPTAIIVRFNIIKGTSWILLKSFRPF